MPEPTFVIVGANLTGGAAATTLRGEGFEGRLVLIGEEPHPPYERPPLSKEYLRGEVALDTAYLREPSWYAENDVELLLGTRATRVDTAGKVVHLADGEPVPYDAVLVATGGRSRPRAVPGRDPAGRADPRTLQGADRMPAEGMPRRTPGPAVARRLGGCGGRSCGC